MSNNGVLLFSFNNEAIRYDKLAKECVRRITKFLDLPVTVVTDKVIPGLDCILTESPNSNSRHYPDYDKNLKFLNGARVNAYDLSPFEKTLVIDTDYLIQSNLLLRGFDTQSGVKMSRQASNIDLSPMPSDMAVLGDSGLRMYWATVLYFDRSAESSLFFFHWKTILDNWQFYVDYFRLLGPLVRNDFAVTLALHKLFWKSGIPSRVDLDLVLQTLPATWSINSLDPLTISSSSTKKPIRLLPIDVHVLNKKSILECIDHEG